ncbi:MAG: hypothetical protein FWH57_07255 [Oscillospiraceae bacterium]|nr:hypothetical protein [Oscillospiraceae bacterium]
MPTPSPTTMQPSATPITDVVVEAALDPEESRIPTGQLALFIPGLVIALGGLIAIWYFKHRQKLNYYYDDDDDNNEYE